MPARCGGCSNPLPSYWSSILVDTYWTTCPHCGSEIARRHGRGVTSGLTALCVVLCAGVALGADTPAELLGGLAGAMVLYWIADTVAWHVSPWDRVPPGAAARSGKRFVASAGRALFVLALLFAALGAFAVRKHAFEGTKEGVYTRVLESSVRDLVKAEEAYFERHHTYADSLDAVNVRPGPGVTITITAAGRTGWSAVATHVGIATVCRISVAAAAVAGRAEGEPDCRKPEAPSPR